MITAIDPGTFFSALVQWDGEAIGKKFLLENDNILDLLPGLDGLLVVEEIRSYGNVMGQTTIDTVWWSGRFCQAWLERGKPFYLMPRLEVKKHICHNGGAKDSNIIQALVDRFAYGEPNRGKGTKKAPGFFYGFRKDLWQAFALAVTAHDKLGEHP